jgi:putative endonuclease
VAHNQDIGKQGEDLATQYLYNLGYHILAKNWRYKRAEVDIIARDQSIIVFVEVKTKTYTAFGSPDESVSAHKERLLVDAAGAYCESIHHEGEIRFDIVAIVIDKEDRVILDHFKDAFFPGIE